MFKFVIPVTALYALAMNYIFTSDDLLISDTWYMITAALLGTALYVGLLIDYYRGNLVPDKRKDPNWPDQTWDRYERNPR